MIRSWASFGGVNSAILNDVNHPDITSQFVLFISIESVFFVTPLCSNHPHWRSPFPHPGNSPSWKRVNRQPDHLTFAEGLYGATRETDSLFPSVGYFTSSSKLVSRSPHHTSDVADTLNLGEQRSAVFDNSFRKRWSKCYQIIWLSL
jgi:hypothetical protein